MTATFSRRARRAVSRLTRRPSRAVQTAIAAASLLVVILALINMGSALPPLGQIGHPDPLWLSVALLAEAASLVAYALTVRQVLAAWGVKGRTRALLRGRLAESRSAPRFPPAKLCPPRTGTGSSVARAPGRGSPHSRWQPRRPPARSPWPLSSSSASP
jgi:hypothetical protein